MNNGHESRSPTKSPSPGQSLDWVNSVESDLRKACDALETAHAAEAEATMAVFLAEIDYEAGVTGASNVSRLLKEVHTMAVREVNEHEEHVKDTIEGEPAFVPTYVQTMSAYADKLKERSETLYKCHTQTLAARHLVAQRCRKLERCKRHLVVMVSNRTNAEMEVDRISGLYVDGMISTDDLLEQQLEFVRSGAVDTRKEHNNATLRFMNESASQCALFDQKPKKDTVHEEESAKAVVHEAVCGLVDRVIQGAEDDARDADAVVELARRDNYEGHDVYA